MELVSLVHNVEGGFYVLSVENVSSQNYRLWVNCLLIIWNIKLNLMKLKTVSTALTLGKQNRLMIKTLVFSFELVAHFKLA